MADEANIPTHRWYQNRNHIKLPMQDVSESVIKAAGIAKIDQFMITAASDALFVAGEVGVWYDPSDLTTLFQDSAGTTPVTAAGQPVGLMLDKSKGLALGANLLVGTYALIVDGGTATATESPSGTLNLTGDGVNGANATQSFATVVGRTYTLRCTVAGSAASVFFGTIAGQQDVLAATTISVGLRDLVFVAKTTTTGIAFRKAGAALSSISSISVRELAGNHATQATAAQRPTYGIHPYSGVRNRANGSADVGNNAVWLVSQTQNGVTMTKTASGFDTDGLPYVDVRYVGTSTGTNHDQAFAFNSAVFAGTSGQQATTSVIARVIAGSISNVNGLQARTSEETAPSTFVGIAVGNLVTASVDTISTATRTLATGNQFRATLSLTFNIASAIDVTYRIKGLQLELGSTRTAYQANYSQYNITEANVPSVLYIGFDGVDDGMVTSAIDFSATDAVTVFAGLRKLSDAARGMVAECGTAGGAASFALDVAPSGGVAYRFNSIGGAGTGSATTALGTAPDTAVLTSLGKISTDLAILRRNGAEVGNSTSDQGTGNYANAILYIGRRGGSSLPFNGNIYSLIIRGAQSTAAQITNTETWVNGKTGAF